MASVQTGGKLDISAYLERIGFERTPNPTIETLQGLHSAHALSIPFENLDIHLGRPVCLDMESLFNKLVTRKRGGYCFEMNGFFAWVLQQLGFQVGLLAARVWYNGPSPQPMPESVPMLSHQLMLVEVDGGRWIADVGFGGHGLILPLEMVPGKEQPQYSEVFRIVEMESFGYMVQYRAGEAWVNMYSFTLQPHYPSDYIPFNMYVSTSPESFFTWMRICHIPTLQGRITLRDDELKVIENGRVTEVSLGSWAEYFQVLEERFGLVLSGDERERLQQVRSA